LEHGPSQTLVPRLARVGWSPWRQLHGYSGAFRWQYNTISSPFTFTCQVRSIYRTVELSEGFAGHLATVEAYFYGLDTLPLFIAIAIFLPFWPGRFISKDSATSTAEEDQSGSSGSEKK
jgi:hypothetical protein